MKVVAGDGGTHDGIMRFFAFMVFALACERAGADGFVHPGMLHGSNDLAFIRAKVLAGEQPWKKAWEKMRADGHGSLKWEARPVEDVYRGRFNFPDRGSSQLMWDSGVAYSHALQWCIAGERTNADKAIGILNAWSSKLKSIGGSDQQLLAGITAYKLCNAAELLRHSNAGWAAADQARFTNMLLSIFYPLIKDFKPKANGNWDAAMINSMLCIAVFTDDKTIFARAANHFLHGPGNGCITNYVFESGQCQETTRDQQHTQLGLGLLADACEVAWKQGVDLYGVAGNRLALGFEYTAKYNLGNDVPCKGTIGAQGRGNLRPIYEKVYRHYAIENGLPMPWTKQVLEKIRPEGWSPDHESWGTLTFFKEP